MTWRRLVGRSVSSSLEEGLAARIADPIWMMARQWQSGELTGDDAPMPVLVTATFESAPVTHYEAGQSGPIDTTVPLETLVEAEGVVQGPAARRTSAEAGLHFLRLLDGDDPRPGLRKAFREAWPFDPGPGDDRDPRGTRWLTLMGRRSLDGAALHAALTAPGADAGALAGGPVLEDVEDQDRAREAAASWLAWYARRYREPTRPAPDSTDSAAWQADRMEYRFRVAGTTSQGELRLAAPDHRGGHLDWYAFDVDDGPSLGATGGPVTEHHRTLLPTTVQYAGMPASRWWEFEDRDVYFGGIQAAPEDIARVVVAAYATVYGDDWFLVPLALPFGSLVRVTSLKVLDDFGDEHVIGSLAENDGPDRPWRFMELSGDPLAGGAPVLYLPRVLSGSENSRPLETVAFVRDEMANMAWAVERVVESPAGRRIDRRARWLAERETTVRAGYTGNEEAWTYTLATRVPTHWVPLVPVRLRGQHEMLFQRGRVPLRVTDEGRVETVGAQGHILQPDRPLFVQEEEVPRGGMQVSRHYQWTRGGDGSGHLWVGRAKSPGRGERSSRLAFDRVEVED